MVRSYLEQTSRGSHNGEAGQGDTRRPWSEKHQQFNTGQTLKMVEYGRPKVRSRILIFNFCSSIQQCCVIEVRGRRYISS